MGLPGEIVAVTCRFSEPAEVPIEPRAESGWAPPSVLMPPTHPFHNDQLFIGILR